MITNADSIKINSNKKVINYNKRLNYYRNNYQYYLILLLPLSFYIIFKYIPMYGLLIAFKDYNFMLGVFKSPWVGLDVFKEIFRDASFWNALINTIKLNVLILIIGFPIPIIFALFLNEISNNTYKRTVQSISYLPHFISWTIAYGIVLLFTVKGTGLVNNLLKIMGFNEINFLYDRGWWTLIYFISFIWKEMGWAAIIYLSALTSINPELYESAAMDGAGRFRCMWSITLPCIKDTIVIMFLLNIGKMMTIGFDQPYMLSNVMVSDISTVLSTYIYDMGLVRARFSFTTAVGMFQAVINFSLLLLADWLAKALGSEGLFGSRKNEK